MGATGDGTTNDSAAIQAANDLVASQGGGRVYFPQGVYMAAGIDLDGGVEFYGSGGAVIRHPNGTTPAYVIRTRRSQTIGSIDRGSSVLNVDDPRQMTPGTPITVRGAGGPSSAQTTTLKRSVSASMGIFTLASYSGLPTNGLLVVDNEVIYYRGWNMFGLTNVRRSQMGTTAASHAAGARISQILALRANVVSVAERAVTLDTPANFRVFGALVYVGTMGAGLSGLTIDGNTPANGSTVVNASAVEYLLTRNSRVTNCVITNAEHAGVLFDFGTTESTIEGNTLTGNGPASGRMGAGIALFRGANGNVVRNNAIGGNSYHGIFLDDRTAGSTDWDAPANGNLIEGNHIDIPSTGYNAGIYVIGSVGNTIRSNTVTQVRTGIAIERSTQGTAPLDSQANTVAGNTLSYHYSGIHITGSYNAFESNVITNTERPTANYGQGNTFDGGASTTSAASEPSATPTPTPTPTSESLLDLVLSR